MSDISVKELRQIKGLGPKKAEIIASMLKEATTVEDLQAVRGVSETLASQVIALRDGEQVVEPKPEPKKATRKRTTKKVTGKATAQPTRKNGRGITLDAGTLRRMARSLSESENPADQAEANRVQHAVADLLDDEPVPASRFA